MSLRALATGQAAARALAQGAAAGEEYAYEVKLDGFRCVAFVDGEELVPAVAHRQAARSLLPRARPARRDATCSMARSWCATRTGARTSTRSASGSTRPPRASSASRARRPPLTSPSTCSPETMSRCSSARSTSAARRSSALLAAPRLRRGADRADGVDGRALGARSAGCVEAEGVIAKERSAPYRPGERRGMTKVKRVRTIDAVVAGWRPGKEPDTVGALILGLYADSKPDAELRVVGHCSGFNAAEKRRLVDFLGAVSRPASAAPPTRAAGARAEISSGLRCAPSWSSRSTSTTSRPGASATAPSCAAGARTRARASARFDQLSR